MDKSFTGYRIEERSFVSYVKREIHLQTGKAHFTKRTAGEIDIIVSEMSSNLVKHAGSGEILFRICETGPEDSEIEILCIDKGPGIADLPRMMRDGVSTSGTLGQGLGAIERLSTSSSIFSTPGGGTIVYSMVSTKDRQFTRLPYPDVDISALCVSKPREVACGDGYRVKRDDNYVSFFLGDGLGHGENALAAVDAAGKFFSECQLTSPAEIIRAMHGEVRRTRGLVAAVVVFDRKESTWNICGVGNIAVRMYNGVVYRNYMSYNGTIGLNIPSSMKDSVLPAQKNQHLIMCSDGIKSRWDITSYPSIFKYDNMILAAGLYRDYSRGHDDSSVLVAKMILP